MLNDNIINIPAKVKIGCFTYDVKYRDGIIDDNAVCYGQITYNDGLIEISNLYHRDRQEVAFVHECLHAISDLMGAEMTEDQTDKMARGLYMMIKDNNIFKGEE